MNMNNDENSTLNNQIGSDGDNILQTNYTQDIAFATNVNPSVTTKKKRSPLMFLLGMLAGSGAIIMLAVIVFLVFIISRTIMKREASSDFASVTNEDMSETVLDKATLSKLEAILEVFDDKSILALDTEEFQRGIIDGLIAGSGDKYAQYYDAEEIAALMGDYGGTFYGIGASLSLNDDGYGEVQSVYENSPAQKGGVRDGDLIVKVDGESILGDTLDEIVAKIRGDKGTDVVLTVYREGETEYLDLTITRDEIEVIVVSSEMLENNIGYIHIAQWYQTTPEQFGAALEELKAQGMTGLVIDVRSNTGGLLTSVLGVCKQMLPEGLIVYTENKYGVDKQYKSDGSNEIDVPVVILTNEYTASASEILTGAMKDHGKAITIGINTYGKGVVQDFTYFTDGSAMKLTVEQYFTPNGTAIDGVGIAPDIEVEFDSEAYYDEENPVDNQLEAAIEYLNENM